MAFPVKCCCWDLSNVLGWLPGSLRKADVWVNRQKNKLGIPSNELMSKLFTEM